MLPKNQTIPSRIKEIVDRNNRLFQRSASQQMKGSPNPKGLSQLLRSQQSSTASHVSAPIQSTKLSSSPSGLITSSTLAKPVSSFSSKTLPRKTLPQIGPNRVLRTIKKANEATQIASQTKSAYQYAMDHLERYFQDGYKVIIDTSSLLEPECDQFWHHVEPLLAKYNSRVYIPIVCVAELQKHASSTNPSLAAQAKPHLAVQAKHTMQRLGKLQQKGYIDIVGNPQEAFADASIVGNIMMLHTRYDMLLITQDRNLANDVMNIANSKSVNGKSINVKKINSLGFLSNMLQVKKKEKIVSQLQHFTGRKVDYPYLAAKCLKKQPNAFSLSKQLVVTSDATMPLTYMPKERDMVQTSKGSIQLEGQIASGGEGIVYATNTPYVAKIYKAGHNYKNTYEKLQLMLSRPIQCEGICYPVELLYNQQGEWVGYLMPKAEGQELSRTVLNPKLLAAKFPDWKKRDLVELAVTILKKMQYLQSWNIIIGDINPANILVKSQKEVYFVDVDSYQVEGYACPVGTPSFTAPEIQGKHYRNFLRTEGNENFAIATLLFMLMLPGKHPYAQYEGGSVVENINSMDFSYPLGDARNGKIPNGQWAYMWSHMTYKVKEAFYKTFRKGEEFASESSRCNASQWLSLFKEYLRLLDDGTLASNDPMSLEIVPDNFKKTLNSVSQASSPSPRQRSKS